MTTFIGISGSLRTGSYNSQLLRAAKEVAPSGVSIDIQSIRDIPLYDYDLETKAFPDSVKKLKELILKSDGVLVCSPEYNNSIPGVLKNTIDWLSRPPGDTPTFKNKPLALMGITPGKGGTMLSQAAWLQVFRSVGVRMWFGPKLTVSNAASVFDANGAVIDEAIKKQLPEFVSGFTDFVKRGT